MTERRPGEYPPFEARAEANEKVDRQKRYAQIKECLKEKPEMTAKEIAVLMYFKRYIPTSERNFTAPRLTEMMNAGTVEVIGKKRCKYTNRKVAVYKLV